MTKKSKQTNGTWTTVFKKCIKVSINLYLQIPLFFCLLKKMLIDQRQNNPFNRKIMKEREREKKLNPTMLMIKFV